MAAICVATGCTGEDAPTSSQPRSRAAGVVELKQPLFSESDWFEDVTHSAGIGFAYRNGEEANQYSILESVGGGVALWDYDRDGRQDIFATGGGGFAGSAVQGRAGRLYRNLGNWEFEDVTDAVGLSKNSFYSHGCFAADYDGDGWTDLLVTGYGRLALYRNCEGVRFDDVTAEAGLDAPKPDLHWSTAAAWADFNLDGRLDLFVGHYVDWSPTDNPQCAGNGPGVSRDICSPNDFEALTQQLFLARGDGTFEEVSERVGLHEGKVLGALAHDINRDGLVDLYVANDALHNHLYLNRGETFEEAGMRWGVAFGEIGEAEGSMGVEAIDLRGDGRFSLFVTNFQGEQHAFYENRGDGVFQHASQSLGMAAIGRNYVGWGNRFFDYDLDGDEDLLIANGHVFRHPPAPESVRQRTLLLENQGPQRRRVFVPLPSAGAYFAGEHRGRGVAVGDLDNDGRLDAVISHVNEPMVVLRNRIGVPRNWIGLELCGAEPRDPIGARVILETSSGRMVREIRGSGGYLSTQDRRVVFGLGDRTVDELIVEWPSGRVQRWQGPTLEFARYSQIVEGDQVLR
jgi:hypothetical protein